MGKLNPYKTDNSITKLYGVFFLPRPSEIGGCRQLHYNTYNTYKTFNRYINSPLFQTKQSGILPIYFQRRITKTFVSFVNFVKTQLNWASRTYNYLTILTIISIGSID